jgi:protein TonB
MKRDMLRNDPIRLSEIFKRTHRNTGAVIGVYRACVAVDGHVSDVEIMKGVPGADEDVVQGMKEGWLFTKQPMPVCFLVSVPISVIQ